jgi:hypothetical protein
LTANHESPSEYGNQWIVGFIIAILPAPMVLIIGQLMGAAAASVLITAMVGAVAGGLTRWRDWPVDRLLLWVRMPHSSRPGTPSPTIRKSEAAAWLESNSGRRDMSTVRALALAGRPREALSLLSGLPQPEDAFGRFGRAWYSASLDVWAGGVPDVRALQVLADTIEDPEERLLARARTAQIWFELVRYRKQDMADARAAAKSISTQLRLGPRRLVQLWAMRFPGLVVMVVGVVVWLVARP